MKASSDFAQLQNGPSFRGPSGSGQSFAQSTDIDVDGLSRSYPEDPLILKSVPCQKHPGHQGFLPLGVLRANLLPHPFQDPKWVRLIELKAKETVKLRMTYTSKLRTEDLGYTSMMGTNQERGGTGTAFLMNMKEEQPCNCSEFDGPHKVSGIFKVMTAAHLVLDDDEARNTEVSFFYDDKNDRSKIVKGKGVRVSYVDVNNNFSVVDCQTHDLNLCHQLENFRREREELIKKIQSQQMSNRREEIVVLISHPHGSVKHVTIGRLLEAKREGEVKITQDGIHLIGCTLTYTTPTCTGSGGGSVNLIVNGVGCEAFAPHCGRDTSRNKADSKEEANISGRGWIIASNEGK